MSSQSVGRTAVSVVMIVTAGQATGIVAPARQALGVPLLAEPFLVLDEAELLPLVR